MPTKQERVIIVGGGLAGIAAAVLLTKQGYAVKIIESRPRLGGRASSILDAETNQVIDNCQHVSMGCCERFYHLCKMTATDSLLTTEQQLHFIAKDGNVNILKNSFLPAPAHLAIAFAKLSYLSLREKFSLAVALIRLMSARRPASGSFIDWLAGQKQSQNLIDRFWNIVLVSALSEDLERLDFTHARKVFLDGFLRKRNAWKVQLLNVPLGEFYDDHLAKWLTNRGTKVELKTGLTEFIVEKNKNNESIITGAKLRNGSVLEAEHFILAVSFDRATSLLPEEVTQSTEFSQIDKIESASITSVHLWFDQPITHLPHVAIIERTSQWIFNRNAILERSSNSSESTLSAGHYYQVVISNSREVANSTLNQQELISHVVKELKEIFPDTVDAQLLHARAMTEHRAVFSVTPGVDEVRPPQQTPIRNLQLAGDWTKTGWASTMESAVRSGFFAAENISQTGFPAEDSP